MNFLILKKGFIQFHDEETIQMFKGKGIYMRKHMFQCRQGIVRVK
jgi:hypothetical protein